MPTAAGTPGGVAVEVRDLVVRRGERAVLDGVSLDVAPGELLALIGPSGAGKSTLLAAIHRLIEPSAGTIHVGGRDVREGPAHVHRRRIGYAFQGVGLFPHLTVAENVAIAPRLLGWDAARIERRVRALLERVGLDPALHAERLPDELSGGQAQRVGVARALAVEPALLLLDEPFGALDPETRARLQEDLARLRASLGVTTLLVSHDLAEALLLADRVAVLIDGRLARVAGPRELLRDPGVPAIEALIAPARARARALAALGEDRGS